MRLWYGFPSARLHPKRPTRCLPAAARGCGPRLGPPRPRSASLGPAQLPSAQLLSHALLTWGVGGSALRTLSSGCGLRQPVQSEPGRMPQRASLGQPLFVSGGRAPLGSQGLRAPPPRSRGASPGKGRGVLGGVVWRGGARRQAERGQGPSWSARGEDAG